MRELLRRLYYLVNRRRLDDELAEEMAFHREMAEQAGGIPLGNSLRLREDARESWGFMWIDRLGQDLRYAFRTMRTSPGFTAAAVLVLSIGIGATVGAFSVFNMVALRPLPIHDPDTLLRLRRSAPNHSSSEVPYPAVVFYGAHTHTLSAVLAMTWSSLNLEGTAGTARTFFVTANFFDELGARPAVGRLLNTADAAPDAPPAVVLGYAFWISHFGSDPSVVGTSIRLNGKPAVVVGVAARDFSGLGSDPPAFWALVEQHPHFVPGSQMLTDFSGQHNGGVMMLGRLRPESTPAMAEEELTALAAELRRQHPDDVFKDERLLSEPAGYAQLVGADLVFGVVGTLALLILIVACGNLGSLLLARGASRQREMLLRGAIGAGPGRLIRQLFTESLTLGAMGCVGGLALGWLALEGLMVWIDAPAWLNPSPDWRVVMFALAVGGLSSVFFGLAPALHVARQQPVRRMKWTRTVLISAQIASSCVLLIIGGLLTRAFERLTSSDPGFDYEHVIVVEPSLAEHGYASAQARNYLRDLTARLRSTAGIEDVSVTSTPPLSGLSISAKFDVHGRTLDVYIHQVDSHYLSTMRIPVVRGRGLNDGDEQGAVVSESLVSRYWADGDPLGQTIKIGDDVLTVVGIAGNARSVAIRDVEATELYRLARDKDVTELAVVARTAGPTDAVASAVSAIASGVDPQFKPRVVLLKDLFNDNVRDIEQGALAVGLLGAIALGVACLGVVGLVAYSVASRTREIGIRLALGAQSRHILTSLSDQFLGTLVGGLLVGVLAAAGLAQVLRRSLYGVSTIDPLAYAGAIVVFLVAVGFAAFWPARRALRVDPLIALRCD